MPVSACDLGRRAIVLDVGLDDRVEHVVGRQRLVIPLVLAQLGAGRPVDHPTAGSPLAPGTLVEAAGEGEDGRLGHVPGSARSRRPCRRRASCSPRPSPTCCPSSARSQPCWLLSVISTMPRMRAPAGSRRRGRRPLGLGGAPSAERPPAAPRWQARGKSMPSASATCWASERVSAALKRVGIETASTADGPERLRRQRRPHERGVDAAREPQHDALEAVVLDVVAQRQHERAPHSSSSCVGGGPRCAARAPGRVLPVAILQRRLEARRCSLAPALPPPQPRVAQPGGRPRPAGSMSQISSSSAHEAAPDDLAVGADDNAEAVEDQLVLAADEVDVGDEARGRPAGARAAASPRARGPCRGATATRKMSNRTGRPAVDVAAAPGPSASQTSSQTVTARARLRGREASSGPAAARTSRAPVEDAVVREEVLAVDACDASVGAARRTRSRDRGRTTGVPTSATMPSRRARDLPRATRALRARTRAGGGGPRAGIPSIASSGKTTRSAPASRASPRRAEDLRAVPVEVADDARSSCASAILKVFASQSQTSVYTQYVTGDGDHVLSTALPRAAHVGERRLCVRTARRVRRRRATVEVTLRLPPPLERPLDGRARATASALLLDGDALVAEARPSARRASIRRRRCPCDAAGRGAGAARPRVGSPDFGECFVCGVARTATASRSTSDRSPAASRRTLRRGSRARVARRVRLGGRSTVRAPTPSAPQGRGDIVLGRMTARVDRVPRGGRALRRRRLAARRGRPQALRGDGALRAATASFSPSPARPGSPPKPC